MKKILFILLLFVAVFNFSAFSATYYTRQNGNWSDPNTWSTTACGGAAAVSYPGATAAGDVVNICNGHTVTLIASVPFSIASIAITSTSSNTALDVAAFTLNVTGNITYSGPTSNSVVNSITVNSGGNLTANDMTMPVTINDTRDCFLNISGTALVTLSGSLTMSGTAARNAVDFGAAGTGTLSVAGSMTGGTLTNGGNGTIKYTSAGAVTFGGYATYYNIEISGGGTKTSNGNVTIGNNLVISAGTLNPSTGNLTVNGTTTIDGAFNDNSNTGINIMVGKVTVNAGGTWNSTAESTADGTGMIFRGGITHNNAAANSFQCGAAQFNTGSPQVIDGAGPMSFSGNVYISGAITVTNQNTNVITMTDVLYGSAGGSTWKNDPNSTLNFANGATSAPMSTGTFDVDQNPNTVNYSRGGNQDVKAVIYHHLTISVSGTKVLLGAITVNGNLTISDATLDADNGGENITVAAGGSTSISGANGVLDFSAAVTASLRDLTMTNGSEINRTVGGATATVNATSFIVNGTGATVDECNFTVSGTTTINGPVTFDDATAGTTKRFQDLVTINAAGSWTSTALVGTALLAFEKGIWNDGTSFNAANLLFDATAQALGGAGTYTIVDAATSSIVTVTGIVLTNNATVDMQEDDNNTLQGTGTWTQGIGSSLTYDGDAIGITAFNASASPNTVNYNDDLIQTVYASAPDFTYWDLIISTSQTKTMANSIDVDDDLDITGTAVLATSSFSVDVTGTTTITGGTLGVNNASGAANLQDVLLSGGIISDNGAGATGTVNIATTLAVDASGGTIGRCTYTISGATTLNGALTYNDVNGVKTIGGAVIINAGGSWTSTAINTAGGLIFQNGITHNGTSFSACDVRFNTRNQTLEGSGTYTIADGTTCIIDVEGFKVTNNAIVDVLENDNANALQGTGTWEQGGSSTLIYADQTITVALMNASAAGNTVDYNRTNNNQTIKNPSANTYYHLTLSGAGNQTKTLEANADVNGNLTISNTAIFSVSAYDMTLAGNWTNNSTNADPFIEGVGTQTVTFDGTAAQTIGGITSTTFNNLTIKNTFPTTAITLATNATVNGTLNLTDGHILTNSTATPVLANGVLTMNVNATVILGTPQDSSFVKGQMAYIIDDFTTRTFPIGKGNDYRRVDLNINQSSTATYTAEMINSSAAALGYATPTLARVSNQRYYEISQSSFVGFTNAQLDIFFQCTAIDDVVEDVSSGDLKVAQDDGAGIWQDRGGTASGGDDPNCGGFSLAGDVISSAFTPFHAGVNRFALASLTGTNPLPVELLSFAAKPSRNSSGGNVVDAAWTTASEFNSDYFEVQRAVNLQGSQNLEGLKWKVVGTVKGAGNSSTVKNYSLVDEDPYPDISYYRLKTVDNDGRVAFSSIVSVSVSLLTEGDAVMLVFPNPSAPNEPFNVSISNQKGKEVLLVVRDVQGREFYSKVIVIANDQEVFAIDPSGKLVSGIYVIIAASDNAIYGKKMVIN